MEIVTTKELLEAGVHFGHRTSRWNPKMAKFIFGKKNSVHIIDLEQTRERLMLACDAVRQTVEAGKDILFVGTKQQCKDVIAELAQRCGAFYVNERWLGGLLTNFAVISTRLNRLLEIERMQRDGQLEHMTKRDAAALNREHAKLTKLLGGVKDMDRLPGLVYLVDCVREKTALAEARRVHVPVVAIVDTNCDPDLVDYPVPGNDDALRSIRLITEKIALAVSEGKKTFETEIANAEEAV